MENQATLEVFLFIHNSFVSFYQDFIVEYRPNKSSLLSCMTINYLFSIGG